MMIFDAHFEHPVSKIGRIYDEEAILQQALRLSKKATEAEGEADEELQSALKMSRLEQEGNGGHYDPDWFGETSRMGAMRNGHGDTAHVSLPELELHGCGWNDHSEEPPPPYEP
ncbi:hypothetical protein SLS56_010817 [Neofusicoccum ribis]|uniref:Uncharacterized protein n=1 Tax=Neofusicoccum ribis TaxID=45134 RepID=A0ABR3SDD6_9PEZI